MTTRKELATLEAGAPTNALCNICEQPAAAHWGCGPRCAQHQYHPGPTLAQLCKERARIDAEISKRLGLPSLRPYQAQALIEIYTARISEVEAVTVTEVTGRTKVKGL